MKIQLRHASTFIDSVTGIHGRRGFLNLVSDGGTLKHQYPCIERADAVRLGAGRYAFEMSEFIPRSELKKAGEEKREPKRHRCLRVLRVLEAAVTDTLARAIRERHMLIHAANYPGQLMGCIAPGLEINERGVVDSKDAMDLIFQQLGGFEQGRVFELEVAA